MKRTLQLFILLAALSVPTMAGDTPINGKSDPPPPPPPEPGGEMVQPTDEITVKTVLYEICSKIGAIWHIVL